MNKVRRILHNIFSPSGKGLGDKGFTLIELLVVVAILGTLAGVVAINVGQFFGAGQQEANDTELANVQTAVVALIAAAQASALDGNYTGINTKAQVLTVQAGGGSNNLGAYLIMATGDTLKQTYDISSAGEVSVAAAGG